ncbi:hypothetical protein BDV18DRAFT_158110 [Aspergillus unguis]
MLSLNISSYSKPSEYQLSELPKPSLVDKKDVIVRVYAASINPIDVKRASGALKLAVKDEFPYKIGYDCAGVVTETGQDVQRFQVGDAVYIRLPEVYRGSCSEIVRCSEDQLGAKPPSLSFEEAASIPLAAMTALQALRQYRGDLTGWTVFVPAGLSGTGLFACQLAKHVFHAGKVITTVSTAKVAKLKEYLGEGTIDQVIDYTKSDPRDVIEHGTVDLLFDTVGLAMECLCLMRPKTSRLISVSTLPSGDQLQESSLLKLPHDPVIPFPFRMALNVLDRIRRLRAYRYSTEYSYMFLQSSGKDLEELTRYVEEGKLRTVVGTTVDLRDIEAVRQACEVVYNGRGGLGKLVIRVLTLKARKNISLVTGASGFIASHVVQQLLEKGNTAHATVRSTKNERKIKHLLDMQEKWPGKLTLFEADLLMAGSFEAPMKGCSVVYHIASPFFIENKIRDGQREVVDPALKGTQHVLDAVQKCESVKVVVVTSSVAAIFGDNADVLEMKDKTLSPDYFNTTSTANYNAYPYSKVLAEKEAWRLYNAQPRPRWKLVTINPGLVLGPSLSPTSDSGSLSLLDQLLRGQLFFGVPDMWFAIVDVREVATAHIQAVEVPDAEGRYILADSKTHSFVELARILRSTTQSCWIPTNKLPNVLVRMSGPVLGLSQKWLRLNLGIPFDIDNRASIDQLKVVYRPLEETLSDHYQSWKHAQA